MEEIFYYNKTVVLHIKINGHFVGKLSRLRDGRFVFLYDKNYIENGGYAFGVDLPLTNKPYLRKEIPPFFRNLASEGWLREKQEKFLGDNSSNGINSFALLALYGKNCFGAISFSPYRKKHDQSHSNKADIEQAVANVGKAMLSGFLPKYFATKRNGEYYLTLPHKCHTDLYSTDLYSTHLAKVNPPKEGIFDSASRYLHDLPKNEFLTYVAMKNLLPCDDFCETELGKIVGLNKEVLFVRRFDRKEDGTKLEAIEFCSLLGKNPEEKYDGSYKEMADFIWDRAPGTATVFDGITTNSEDIKKLFLRICASILVGNSDTHFKNFALVKKGNEWRLSPNYDLVHCACYKNLNSLALAIGHTKNLRITDLKPKHIVMLGQDFRLSKEEIRECIQELGKNIKQAIQALNTIKDNADSEDIVTPALVRSIIEHMQKRWNGTFRGVEEHLNKLSDKRFGSVTKPEPTSLEKTKTPAVKGNALSLT